MPLETTERATQQLNVLGVEVLQVENALKDMEFVVCVSAYKFTNCKVIASFISSAFFHPNMKPEPNTFLPAVSKSCGQSTHQNCTYFTHNGYPSSFDGSGSCQLTVYKCAPDICQLK